MPRLKTLAPRIPVLEQRHSSVAILTTSPQRIRGRQLQRIRQAEMRANPLCALCLEHGITRAADERDHKIPLWEGGTDTPDNTWNLCLDCHAAKTAAEATRRAGNA